MNSFFQKLVSWGVFMAYYGAVYLAACCVLASIAFIALEIIR